MTQSRVVGLLACLAVMLVGSCLLARPVGATSAVSDAAVEDNRTVATATPAPRTPFNVFGYLPEYRQGRFDYEAVFRAGLTHLIFFSAEVDPATLRLAHVADRLPPAGEWACIRRLADTCGVKLLLCIGGGGRSGGFATLVADTVRRMAFAAEVNAVLLERRLDGIDINWEYPQTMTEWLHFGQFLLELRSVLGHTTDSGTPAAGPLDKQGRRTRVRDATLSMALHPHPSIAAVLQSSGALRSLDYVHWMAYDHVVGTEPHSSVEYAASTLSEDMIGLFDETAWDKSRTGRSQQQPHRATDHRRKLTLGVPFYGRHREDRRLQPETYSHLWLFLQQWARKKHPTWVEGGAELRAMSEYGGYSYTGYDDVRRKMRLAREANVSGIMIWELGQDVPPGTSPMSLMTAVHEQLTEWGATSRRCGAGVPSREDVRQSPSPDTADEGDL
ncbi:chitinase [Novymonas esmeraldas]|uniref:Chitinase n=1 Tax=Novymonas esmeraldas TaxID=1808958 RepID=A0AAW0ELT3_9TRYP